MLSSHVQREQIDRYRALFNGVRSGDEKAVRALLAEGMQVNLRGPRGATPLHIAARFGQISMVDLLLNHGADANARDDRGASPFDKAQSVGLSSITSRLASTTTPSGASATLPARPRTAPGINTPAALASASHAARSSLTADARCRRLLEAAYKGDTHKIAEMLASEPKLVNQPGPRGATALHVASRYGWPDAIQLLLNCNADITIKDEKGNTPLQKAKQMRQSEAAAILSPPLPLPLRSSVRTSKFVSKPAAQPSLFTPPPQQPTRAPVTTDLSASLPTGSGSSAPKPPPPPPQQPVDVTDDAIQSDELLENALVAAKEAAAMAAAVTCKTPAPSAPSIWKRDSGTTIQADKQTIGAMAQAMAAIEARRLRRIRAVWPR